MCFSASASFGTGIVLGTIGVITLSKVKEPLQIPFGVIPIMFAVQQFSEGMIWIGLSEPGYTSWQHFPVYIFLMFSQVIWPVWIPFSVWLLEKNPIRRRILMALMIMGLIVSAYLLYCLFTYQVSASIRSGHIQYTLDFPTTLASIASGLYFVSLVIPLFISSVKRMLFLGGALLASFILTWLFFEDHLISVWCFFAAILSLIVLGITTEFNKQRSEQGPFVL